MSPIVTFYRPFAAVATFVSLFTCYLMLSWGSAYYLLTLFWIKAASSALFGTIFHFTRAEQLTFYHNLGYSTRRLYLFTAVMDVAIWILLITLTMRLI